MFSWIERGTEHLLQLTAETHSLRSDELFHKVCSACHLITAGVAEAERLGAHKHQILESVAEARRLHSQSPFVRRLQEWPRGYPGDFETIEYLVEQENRAEVRTVAWCIEEVALSSPMAQQHRNKLHYQAELVDSVIRRCMASGRRPRVLSVACGGSLDLLQARMLHLKYAVDLTLNDADDAALALSQERLDKLSWITVQQVPGHALKALRALRRAEPFDLIMVGGLLDYLDDREAILLMRASRQVLRENGGQLYLSNVAHSNPYRAWLQFIASWSLIERAPEAFKELLVNAGFLSGNVSVVKEPTKLSCIALAVS